MKSVYNTLNYSLYLIIFSIAISCSNDTDNSNNINQICESYQEEGVIVFENLLNTSSAFLENPSSVSCIPYKVASEDYLTYLKKIKDCVNGQDLIELEVEIQDLETELTNFDCDLIGQCNPADGNCAISEFTDVRDGRTYSTVEIGTQTWMAENFDYYTSEDSWYYENDSLSYHKLGRLYTWEKAKSLAPSGWHLPSEEEFNVLINYLGGASVASGSLKEVGTEYWKIPNSNATNSSGFTALGGGTVDSSVIRLYNYIFDLGCWWTSSPGSTTNNLGPIPVYFVIPYTDGPTGYFEDRWNTDGLSVRYIKD